MLWQLQMLMSSCKLFTKCRSHSLQVKFTLIERTVLMHEAMNLFSNCWSFSRQPASRWVSRLSNVMHAEIQRCIMYVMYIAENPCNTLQSRLNNLLEVKGVSVVDRLATAYDSSSTRSVFVSTR